MDDRCYECTKSSLKVLYKYFTIIPLCEFCDKDYKWDSFNFFFSSVGHVSKIEVSCA